MVVAARVSVIRQMAYLLTASPPGFTIRRLADDAIMRLGFTLGKIGWMEERAMRVVLGVDGKHEDRAALNLVKRLRFGADGAGCEADLVNVIEALPFPWWGAGEMSSPEVVEQLMEAQEEIGTAVTKRAAADLGGAVRQTRCVIRHGSAPDQLMVHAEEAHADLIAVGGRAHGNFSAFLTGSVGRGLVIGAKQNLLIAKGEVAPEGPVRAVLATDHSRYAERCLTTLLALAPKGLSHLTVLTAYPRESVEAIRPFLPEYVLDPASWIDDSLRQRNDRVIGLLAPLGCAFDGRVVNDTPNAVIKQTMEETGADLLILGAQGHGWVERLTLGSVSFHQVVAEPFSVLVLRASAAKGEDSPGKASEMNA
jgi:nucleotide-binding universal stress UspA family protein